MTTGDAHLEAIEAALREGSLEQAVARAREALQRPEVDGAPRVLLGALTRGDVTGLPPTLAVATALVQLVGAADEGGIDDPLAEAMAGVAAGVLTDLSAQIETDAGDYPTSPVSAGVWMDGGLMRDLTWAMARHYRDQHRAEDELQMLFVRAKVTNSIMSHYHHEVGPAMVAVGDCYERLGRPDKAAPYYRAVMLDFERFLEQYADTEEVPPAVDRLSLEALVQAYNGHVRTGAPQDLEDVLRRLQMAESILARKSPGDSTPK